LSDNRGERSAGSSSGSDGYVSGGQENIVFGPSPSVTRLASVDSFPFSSPFTTATIVSNLTVARQNTGGHSARAFGEASVSGGSGPSGTIQTIDRFPFSAPFIISTNVGTIGSAGRSQHGVNSGPFRGYISGGLTGIPTSTNRIEAFPFANPFVVTSNIGDLSPQGTYATNTQMAGQNSLSNGYLSGRGYNGIVSTSPSSVTRFPFASPFTVSTDIGNLSQTRYDSSGNEGP